MVRTAEIRTLSAAFEDAEKAYLDAFQKLVDVCTAGSDLCGAPDGAAAFRLLGRDGNWFFLVEERGAALRRGANLLANMMGEVEGVIDLVKAEPEGGVQ
jgi:hypothetical protein